MVAEEVVDLHVQQDIFVILLKTVVQHHTLLVIIFTVVNEVVTYQIVHAQLVRFVMKVNAVYQIVEIDNVVLITVEETAEHVLQHSTVTTENVLIILRVEVLRRVEVIRSVIQSARVVIDMDTVLRLKTVILPVDVSAFRTDNVHTVFNFSLP
jgi:hypothetical protein